MFKKLFKISVCLLFLTALAVGCARTNVIALPPPAATQANSYSTPLTVGSQHLLVSIADTAAKQQQGLSGQSRLADNQGMLFALHGTTTTSPGFWMKDMLFALDLIWIKDGKIVGITADVPVPATNDNLPTYYPPSLIDEVLEVNAGWAKAHQIKVGDSVKEKVAN